MSMSKLNHSHEIKVIKSVSINEGASTDHVRNIWQNKMEESELFLPTEIDFILSNWMKFIWERLKSLHDADADEFYLKTAEFAAEKLKHFVEHGWECLNMEFPYEDSKSSTEFSSDQSGFQIKRNREQINTEDVSKESSAVSISDALEQFNFLMKLIASNNFGLNLVKNALNPSFKRTFVEMEYHQAFLKPKRYLNVEFHKLNKDQIRKSLLDGAYDDYILPLQIANEINDDFWIPMEIELTTKTS